MTSMEELKHKIEVLERQLAEKDKKIREKDMIFEFILESSLAGYWDWYIQDDYEYMSPSFKKMFGYEDHEIENKPQSWQKIIHPEDLQGVFEVFNAHIESKGEKPYRNTVRYFHKNGSIVWVHCCGQVIEWGEDGKPLRMIGSHIDITLLKNVEKKLQVRNKELNELNKSLKEFTHVVSHDLQEPLRGIKNNCVFLLEDYEFTPEITATIERVIHLAKYSKDLLDDLLMYSSLGIEATISEVDVYQLLLTLKKAFVYSSSNVEIEIEGNFPSILSDESLLTQVFRNLIANGIKYNRSEVKHIKVGFLAEQNTFYVADNGIGIKERHYAKIFRIFCRLNKKSDFPEGTGVGLNLVKKIVEKHDGRIWVESEYGKGTKFFFTLNNLECDNEEQT